MRFWNIDESHFEITKFGIRENKFLKCLNHSHDRYIDAPLPPGIVRDKNILNKSNCKKAIRNANKLMASKGRLLVRKSGTESKIRIMGESHNKNLILKCIKIIKRSIKN